MSQWPFVIAAYAMMLGGTAALLLTSWRDLRRAERDPE